MSRSSMCMLNCGIVPSIACDGREGGLLDWAGVLFCRVGGRWSRGRIMHERERMRDSVARDLSPAD